MGFPRSRTVDPAVGAIYHCVSRCSRRLFLIDDDVRASWIIKRLELLTTLFAVDVIEYAVLANHIHLILRSRPELAWCWTREEVATRWLLLRSVRDGSLAVDRAAESLPRRILEAMADEATIDEWRSRLSSLSWFHKELKEPCARMWNRQDKMLGSSFWQGRYTAKVAANDAALICQSVYVLLNRVRAGAESDIGATELTSIGKRMKDLMTEIRAGKHDDALATFRTRVDDGLWTPVFPCVPGSVADLPDEEYANRVARGRHRVTIRQAVRKQAETINRLSTDAPVEELMALAVATTTQGTLQRPLPHHCLKPRSHSIPLADVRSTESAWLTVMKNPHLRTRLGATPSEPVVEGMTLGAIIHLADMEGRRVRPDKKGHIAADAPRAIAMFRERALGDAGHGNRAMVATEEALDSPSQMELPPKTGAVIDRATEARPSEEKLQNQPAG